MTRITLPPHAASLMQSVRGVGYDVRSAVADLIDNSIAAGATTVQLSFNWAGRDSVVSLLDDGQGMDRRTLAQAMTLGSHDPSAPRSASDLGRFGLGLKTASLSQCSRLLVASKTAGGPVSVLVWDLDTVAAANDWLVDEEVSEIEQPYLIGLAAQSSGTLVLWSRLDRLVGDAAAHDAAERLDFQQTALTVEAHLAMVFHRFLEGRPPRLKIFINGVGEENRVMPWDPFSSSHPATQHLGEASRAVGGSRISMQGYVLPHKDRFEAPEDFEKAAGSGGWVSQQGFYIYRNERLLVAGSWLGLGKPRKWPKDEQHKLARIRLDLPNTFDAEWRIDVKKSRAEPPLSLRDWLRRNAERVRAEAKEVFIHRGNRASPKSQSQFCPVWFSEGGGAPRYRINRDHPLVSSLVTGSAFAKGDVEKLIRLLETTVPIHRIWLDVADKPEVPAPTRQQLPEELVATAASDLLGRLMSGQSLGRSAALNRIRHIEPFDQFPEVLAALEHP